MTVLDVFSILFKSNAADVKKQMAEAEKSTKDFQQQINTADLGVKNLATSMLKVGVEAVSAFATFEGLKAGITNAINFNAELEKTHILTGMSSRELATYDATFAQFGANSGDFTNWLSSAAKNIQLTNGSVENVIPNLRKLAAQLQNASSDAEALQQFRIKQDQWQLPDSFFLALRQGPEAFDKMMKSQNDLIAANEELSQQGLELQSEWKAVESSFVSAFSQAMPVARFFLKVLQDIGEAGRTLFDLLSFNFTDLAKPWNAEERAALNNSGAPQSNGSIPSGTMPLGMRNNNPGNLRSWGGAGSSGGFAQFPTLAAGLSAEQKQLQLYGNRGINTLSGIASTWAPSSENDTASYIAGLVKSTGFSANQRLDLNDPSVRAAIANAINKQEEGAAYANLIGTAHAAITAADTNPLNSSPSASGMTQLTPNISIGTVTINSPTGDPVDHARLFQEHLNGQLSFVNANLNDGIKS